MPIMFDTPINTNDLSIDRVLGAGLPVLLVFLNGKAPALLEGSMERLSSENAGKLILAKVDLKDNPASARRLISMDPLRWSHFRRERFLHRRKASLRKTWQSMPCIC